MNGTVKRLIVAGSAILSVSTALVLSSGASQAQSRGFVNDTYMSEPTNLSPAHPDAGIRGQGN